MTVHKRNPIGTCWECREPEVEVFYTSRRGWVCETCRWARPSRLTRQERLEGLADAGVDTWEEYREER